MGRSRDRSCRNHPPLAPPFARGGKGRHEIGMKSAACAGRNFSSPQPHAADRELGLFSWSIPPSFVPSHNMPMTNNTNNWLCFGAFLETGDLHDQADLVGTRVVALMVLDRQYQ